MTHGAHAEKDEQQPKDTGNLTTSYHGLGLTDRQSGDKCSTWWGSRERRAGGEKAREGAPSGPGPPHKSSYCLRCILWMMSRQSLNTRRMFSVSTAQVKCG